MFSSLKQNMISFSVAFIKLQIERKVDVYLRRVLPERGTDGRLARHGYIVTISNPWGYQGTFRISTFDYFVFYIFGFFLRKFLLFQFYGV